MVPPSKRIVFPHEGRRPGAPIRRKEARLATKKEIMRRLLRGGVSWNETARVMECSKAALAKYAAKMERERIDSVRLKSMTDVEISGLIADSGRSKRGEELMPRVRLRARLQPVR